MRYDDVTEHAEQWLGEPSKPEPYTDSGRIWDVIVLLAILAALLLGILFCGGAA